MKTKYNGKSPSARLEIGSGVLAAVAGVDTALVTGRLTAFAAAHQNYSVAQQKVDALQVQVRIEQNRLGELDSEQNRSVEEMARLLITDRKPRRNPFATFGVDSPSVVVDLVPGEKTKAVNKLVAAVRLDKHVSPATLAAASVTEEAARQIEVTLLALETHRATLRDARTVRDALMPVWDATLAALRRAARAAGDDGAPGLYVALFGNPKRSKKLKAEVNADAKAPAAA